MSRILPVLIGAFLLSYAANDGKCGTSPQEATRGVVPPIPIVADPIVADFIVADPIVADLIVADPIVTDRLLADADTLSAFPDTAALSDNTALADNAALLSPADDHSGESCLFTKLADLGFGGIFTSPVPGTITVHPDGTASYSGGVYAHTNIVGGTPGAALIELNLENPKHCTQHDRCSNDNNEYDRTEDDDNAVNDSHDNFTRHGMTCSLTFTSPSKLTRTGGTETMTADSYTISRTKGDISIGATLHVGANQVSGSYSGVFYVTLTYQ